MADDLENSGQWRDTVETRLSTLETKVEEEARLRAAMDEDLSGARADRNMLQALHKTQSEHSERFTKLETKMDAVNERLGAVEGRLDAVEGRLGAVEGRLGAVEGRLGAVESTLKTVHVGIKVITDKLDRLIGDEG